MRAIVRGPSSRAIPVIWRSACALFRLLAQTRFEVPPARKDFASATIRREAEVPPPPTIVHLSPVRPPELPRSPRDPRRYGPLFRMLRRVAPDCMGATSARSWMPSRGPHGSEQLLVPPAPDAP